MSKNSFEEKHVDFGKVSKQTKVCFENFLFRFIAKWIHLGKKKDYLNNLINYKKLKLLLNSENLLSIVGTQSNLIKLHYLKGKCFSLISLFKI